MDIPAWWQSVGLWWNGDGWAWVSEWAKSPGFAGFAAVIAATLAFAGSRHQARLNAWWQRIEWALKLYTSSDSTPGQRLTGLAAIGALQRSKLATRSEQDFVTEIIDATTLDPLGDGVEHDDLPAPDAPYDSAGYPQLDETYSVEEAKEATDDQERV